MLIAVDIDDVLNPYSQMVLKVGLQHFKKNMDDFKQDAYETPIKLGIPTGEWKAYEANGDAGDLLCGEPLPHAKEVLRELMLCGHDVIIITSRTPERRWRVSEKCAKTHGIQTVNGFATEHDITKAFLSQFDCGLDDKLVYTNGETKGTIAREYGVDFAIEDYVRNCLDYMRQGIPVIVLDQPHNRHVDDNCKLTRCWSWEDIKHAICRYCGRCAEPSDE